MDTKFEWIVSNGQKYLFAQGHSRFELGVAIGQGNHKKISAARKLYRAIIEKRIGGGENRERLNQVISAYCALIPEEDMEEIKGMQKGYVEESGEDILLEELALQSFGIDLSHQFETREEKDNSLDGCTNFACINADGTVIHGQNYDSDPAITGSDSFIHTRTHGRPDTFLYRPGASLGMAMGKNESGVAMTVSVIKSNVTAPIMTPRSVLIQRAMEKETALSAIREMTDERGRSSFCYNLIVSDSKTVVGSQATPEEQRICQIKRALVQSNQYDYIDWIKYLKKPSYSKRRQVYAEETLQSFISRYGILNNEDLLEILKDDPIICRKRIGDGIGTTVLFLTRESFGRGNPLDNPAGRIPF